MTELKVELWKYRDKYYVTAQDAARCLAIAPASVQAYVYSNRLRGDYIENRFMIEYESLKQRVEILRKKPARFTRRPPARFIAIDSSGESVAEIA